MKKQVNFKEKHKTIHIFKNMNYLTLSHNATITLNVPAETTENSIIASICDKH